MRCRQCPSAPAVDRTYLSSQHTTSGSQNSIGADPDTGVVCVVIVVVDDQGFVCDHELAAAVLLMLIERPRPLPK